MHYSRSLKNWTFELRTLLCSSMVMLTDRRKAGLGYEHKVTEMTEEKGESILGSISTVFYLLFIEYIFFNAFIHFSVKHFYLH